MRNRASILNIRGQAHGGGSSACKILRCAAAPGVLVMSVFFCVILTSHGFSVFVRVHAYTLRMAARSAA